MDPRTMDTIAGARPLSQAPRTLSARRVLGHVARVALGSIFLAAGVLKGLDPAEFAHQMAGYGLVGERVAAAGAPALIVLEILLGTVLLAGIRPRWSALASLVLLSFFIAIEAYGISTGRTESCGCFGAYAQRTPAQVIGEDLVFMGLAILSLWGLKDWRGIPKHRARVVLAVAGILAATFVIASPSLPIDDYVTLLRPGRSLADLGLAARVPGLGEGRHLVALIDVTDSRAAEVAARLDALAGGPGSPLVVGLTPSTEQEIDAFRWSAVPAFEIHRIDRDIIKRLYRRLPRFFVVESGRIRAVYDGAPPEAKDLLSSEAS